MNATRRYLTTHGSIVVLATILQVGCGDASALGLPAPSDTTAVAFPITGPDSPGMGSYDRIIPGLMKQYRIPGGAVAVVKDGKLVFAHGYGWADVEDSVKVQPDALFRVASLSKPITAVAVMKLSQDGMLGLDDQAFSYLSDLAPPAGATEDPRLASITIAELLQHSGGWDRDQSFDPMFQPQIAADAVGAPAPASAETIIRYMLGEPLQFDPGTRYAYSNFGYDVLGRVIERVTGTAYADWVQQNVLEPAGVLHMIAGHTRLSEADPREVRYYAVPGQPLTYQMTPSVFPGDGVVPTPYGGFYIEAMDSHGGWVSSTIDYLRLIGAVDGRPERPDILSAGTIQTMTALPPAANATWHGSAYWYAMGWLVRPWNGDANWWHSGSLPGTTTLVVRAWNGLAWAAFFNARTATANGDPFGSALDPALWTASEQVTSWPTQDLFGQFK
jgi:CubicO group peptidase (beta-lactamase class C family)